MRVYRPGTTPTGDLSQTQRYLRQELSRIEQSIDSVREEIIRNIGHGSIYFVGSAVAADLGATWFDYDLNDTAGFEPVGCKYDLVSGSITLEQAGLWEIVLDITLDHNLDNAGARQGEVRLGYGSEPTVGLPFTVNRSTSQTAIHEVLDLTATEPGGTIEIQLRSLDGISSVVYKHSRLYAVLVSPYLKASDVDARGR